MPNLYCSSDRSLIVTVAHATQNDASAFHNLATQIDNSGTANFNFASELQWPSARYFLVRRATLPTRRRSKQLLRALLNALKNAFFTVPVEMGELVGGAGMWLTADGVANVSFIGILPQYQARRIGIILLAHLLETATKSDCRKITLELRQSNQIALDFYKKHGFVETGTIPNYYQTEKEDAITMALSAKTKAEMRQISQNARAKINHYWHTQP